MVIVYIKNGITYFGFQLRVTDVGDMLPDEELLIPSNYPVQRIEGTNVMAATCFPCYLLDTIVYNSSDLSFDKLNNEYFTRDIFDGVKEKLSRVGLVTKNNTAYTSYILAKEDKVYIMTGWRDELTLGEGEYFILKNGTCKYLTAAMEIYKDLEPTERIVNTFKDFFRITGYKEDAKIVIINNKDFEYKVY